MQLVSSFVKNKQVRDADSSNPFSGVFDKSKEAKGVQDFSSFGGVGSSQQTKTQDLNFEFIPDTKLNSLDLDFLSTAFLVQGAGMVTQPPKKVEPPKPFVLPNTNKVDAPAIKSEVPAKKWKEPESKIKVPQQVANKLIDEKSKTIVATQQAISQPNVVQPPPALPTSSNRR